VSLAFRYDISGYSFGCRDAIWYRNIYTTGAKDDWAVQDGEIMLVIEFWVRVQQVFARAFENRAVCHDMIDVGISPSSSGFTCRLFVSLFVNLNVREMQILLYNQGSPSAPLIYFSDYWWSSRIRHSYSHLSTPEWSL
jgi:hypothetical protein